MSLGFKKKIKKCIQLEDDIEDRIFFFYFSKLYDLIVMIQPFSSFLFSKLVVKQYSMSITRAFWNYPRGRNQLCHAMCDAGHYDDLSLDGFWWFHWFAVYARLPHRKLTSQSGWFSMIYRCASGINVPMWSLQTGYDHSDLKSHAKRSARCNNLNILHSFRQITLILTLIIDGYRQFPVRFWVNPNTAFIVQSQW